MEARGIGARRLDLVFLRVDNIAQAARVGLSCPTREPVHLSKLLAERLVVIDPGFGIETASLTASWVEALPERQTVGRHLARGRNAMLMSVSSSTRSGCGSARTTCFAWHRSKARCRNAPCAASPRLNPLKAWIGQKTCRARRGFSCSPEKIEAVAELPDHPPRLFIWRGARHRVAKADGPERIHGEWWRSDSETKLIRDYYRVETSDGARYWIFRDAPAEQGGGWWLHGVGEA